MPSDTPSDAAPAGPLTIESYSFGQMTVAGKLYTRDLIVFPREVRPGWRRKEGHSLALADLAPVIAFHPRILVAGTGACGGMKIPEKTAEGIRERHIELIARPTGEAWKTYNGLLRQGRNAAGAFHLTC